MIKFVKYLPLFNWQPVVLTVKKPRVNCYDYTLLGQLQKGLSVLRTPSFEFGYPYHRTKQLNIRSGKRRNYNLNSLLMSVLNKIKPWLCIPDSRIGWMPFALFRGFKTIKKEKIDVIMVIAEPFSSFISGVLLKFICRKPLILDFRDEWNENNKYLFVEKNKVIRKIEGLLESACVRYSDKVISVTQNIIDNFNRHYKECSDKFTCITNGFDPEDFNGLKESQGNRDLFTISYAGAIYLHRSPGCFLEAIAGLINERPEFSKILRLNFIGDIAPEIKELINNNKFKENISVRGFLNHADTLDILKNSDILLYIEDDVKNSDRILPAKLFEYMAIKKPVLALVGEGVAKNTVMGSKIGLTADPKDPSQIKRALYSLYDAYYNKKNKFCPDEDFINQFDRKHTTAELASVLETVVK